MRVARSVAAVALVVAGVAGVQSPVPAAAAAPHDPAKMEAVTEIEDGMWPIKKTYAVAQGEVVPAPLGVQSADSRPVRGLVAQVRFGDELRFARRYRNCWYTRGADGEMAWCSFPAVLAPYRSLAITAPMVAVQPTARPGAEVGIGFRWQSRAWADARGGLRKVVDYFAVPGAPVVAGTGGVLTLEARELPTADIRTNGNSVPVQILAGTPAPSATPTATGTPAPSATPTATATAAPTATATGVGTAEPTPSRSSSPAAAGAGGAAGLPVTGPRTALLGAALLGAGVLGYLLSRRRRNRFVA